MTLLVGDIGGTHGRFATVEGGGLRPGELDVREGDAYATFEEALAAHFDGADEKPRRASFAVAGPVGADGTARITNRAAWVVDPAALKRRFGFERVLVVNDFVAQAASLPHLDGDEVVAIGSPGPQDAAKVALGPGTGLGVAGLVRDLGGGWLPVASEGGHVEFAAIDRREAAAFEIIRREKGRVEAEALVSGPGIARLHAALAEVEGRAPDGASTPDIVSAATKGDPPALATVTLFLTLLARFSGDMALVFEARGGVYLCGGVAPRLIGLIDPEKFRATFEAKAPHEAMLRETATLVVTSPSAGLIGAAAVAGRMA